MHRAVAALFALQVTGLVVSVVPVSSQTAEQQVAVHPQVARSQQACERGEADSCVTLGRHFQNGAGVPRDLGQAGELYARACELDESSCREWLSFAVKLAKGDGVPRDIVLGAALAERACAATGDDDGCLPLLLVSYELRGSDFAHAATLAERACDLGSPEACKSLYSFAYQFRHDPGLGQHAERALELFGKSCDAGNRSACEDQARLRDELEAIAPALAVSAPGIDGRISGLEAVSAYAFPGPLIGTHERGLVLVLMNRDVDLEWLSGWLDRRQILNGIASGFRAAPAGANLEGLVVAYLAFRPDGSLQGVSWGPVGPCVRCSVAGIEADVEVIEDRLAGSVRGRSVDAGYTIDLTMAMTVTNELPGEPLPPGGGAPGAAFTALSRALHSDQRGSVPGRIAAEWWQRTGGPEPERLEELGDRVWLDLLDELVWDRTPPALDVAGYLDGDRCLLVVEADVPWGEVRAEVRMVREDGMWKYSDHLLTHMEWKGGARERP